MDCIYFCGNSLGLQPKQARTLVNQEMDKWQQMYVCKMYMDYLGYRMQDAWLNVNSGSSRATCIDANLKEIEIKEIANPYLLDTKKKTW